VDAEVVEYLEEPISEDHDDVSEDQGKAGTDREEDA
jgi:hypothetical protein